MKKGQGLSIETIVIAVIVLIVLVVLIMIFTGKIGEWTTQTREVGDIKQFAGGEVSDDGNCMLDTGLFGICKTVCPEGRKAGKQSLSATPDQLCKFGYFCCGTTN